MFSKYTKAPDTEIYSHVMTHHVWLYLIFLGGLIISVALIPAIIAWQRRREVGQTIYDDGPKSHAAKQGTPTMGGLAFLVTALAAFIYAWMQHRYDAVALAMLALAAGCIGAVDDLLKIVKKRPLGLKARWKVLLLTIVGAGFAGRYAFGPAPMLPVQARLQQFFGYHFMLTPWVFFVLALLAIVGTANAVNLTDGLDGLAAGAALPVLLVLAACTFFSAPITAVVGACVGFLWFNRHPAKVFMGDTGSLLLGALIAGAAIQCGWLFVLPLIGIVFVVEALSVIAQVVSFKLTGKRIFKMSPLHHHFELSGWNERQTTRTFIAVSCAAALSVGLVMMFT